jgi:hypothetical protein
LVLEYSMCSAMKSSLFKKTQLPVGLTGGFLFRYDIQNRCQTCL